MTEYINRIKIKNRLLKKIMKSIQESELPDSGQKVLEIFKARTEWKRFLQGNQSK